MGSTANAPQLHRMTETSGCGPPASSNSQKPSPQALSARIPGLDELRLRGRDSGIGKVSVAGRGILQELVPFWIMGSGIGTQILEIFQSREPRCLLVGAGKPPCVGQPIGRAPPDP